MSSTEKPERMVMVSDPPQKADGQVIDEHGDQAQSADRVDGNTAAAVRRPTANGETRRLIGEKIRAALTLMKIFLSHRSRDKALVREFKSLLPRFLDTWLDEESLSWGDSVPAKLKSSIQSGVDFLIIFLDKEALSSSWVKQELAWALDREKELKRTFVLPILLGELAAESLPTGFSDRLHLRLADFRRASVEALASRVTLQLFQLVVESFSTVQLEIPRRESLNTIRDSLSAGQAKLLGYVVQQCSGGSEVKQREIENAMGYPHSSAEVYYRLEALVGQGFLLKRRIAADGQFSYRLTSEFDAIRED